MDEFKIGDDIEETPGTSRIRKENNIIPIIIVVIVAIAIGLGVFFISNSILNPKKKEVKSDFDDKNESEKSDDSKNPVEVSEDTALF